MAPSVNSKLAKTIEQRFLATLRRSKYGYMDFWTLVKRSKCERWLELCKHVYGYMEYKKLVESPTAGNLVALSRSGQNHVGMTQEMDYLKHLKEVELWHRREVASVRARRKEYLAELKAKA